jgi:Tfp pilus assembly protein PilF
MPTVCRAFFLCLVTVSSSFFLTAAQSAEKPTLPKPDATKEDYSHEAAVIEQLTTTIAFENDGNFSREQNTRVRVQTDPGVKAWGLLSFPYQSATQSVEVDYVRVLKADGSTVVTPADNIQDIDSEITREAPFYSDLREKHVAVKGLAQGDVLEYAAHWRTTKTLVPGQFWFAYDFHREGIVVSEKLEVKVPTGRSVKVKGPEATQTVTTKGSWRVYAWANTRLHNEKDPASEQKRATEAALGRLPPPDVQVSSFQSWAEIGHWYWSLQKDHVQPTAAIRSKAAELTKGLTDDRARERAIYSFVSTQYRYIGVAFGIGRYQPHAADDVLSNSYGDCKDKHTLLASLLQASGITIYPALVSSAREIDPDVPSPAQFDHVIGYMAQDDREIWLDTTPEVAPFGYLLQQLRDKKALVMSAENSAKLINTPADPSMPSTQNFKIDGKLNDDGTFEAKVEYTVQGEHEIVLREAFRQVPQPQWRDLVQQISYQLGYSGMVSDVRASTPETISEPFHFAYSYNRKDYPDWTNHQFTVAGLPFIMPPIRDDSKYPIWLGPPLETISDSKVELPNGYVPVLPVELDLNYDFAEYHATYSEDHGTLTARRRLVVKVHEVAVAEFEQYRGFLKRMADDVNQYVQTSSSRPLPAVNSAQAADSRVSAFANRIRELPESSSSEANGLEAAARQQMSEHDLAGAVSSLYRAVSADPKFTRAWVLLGVSLLGQNQLDAGIDAFHKAMDTDPNEAAIPKALGFTLMGTSKFIEAVPIWQDYMKSYPADADGPANLGTCFSKLRRYRDAASSYEASLKIKDGQPGIQIALATAYILGDQREKADAAFKKLAEVDSQKMYLNDAAYEMANHDLDLPLALNYAKQAVRRAEEDSQKITLHDLKVQDLDHILVVAAYWDTLGWVNERMSNMATAEEYLKASWRVNQDGVVAGHLCHLYRRLHEKTAAIQMCRNAISRMSMSKHVAPEDFSTELAAAQENLKFLTGHQLSANTVIDTSDQTIAQRTFKLPRFLPGTESAEFFVLLSSDDMSKKFRLEDTKFISGSEKMKLQGKQLRSIDFNVPAPSEVPTKFVWRGILGCYQYTGCSFVVLDPVSVHSLN